MAESKNTGSNAAPRNPTLERVAGLDGASDAPRGSAAGSHRGSAAGSRVGSQAGSRAGSPPRQSHAAAGDAKPLGHDPARELTEAEREVLMVGKRIDLPIEAFIRGTSKGRFTTRPGFNTSGKPIEVALNIFAVENFTDKKVYQYDVSISPVPKTESKGLIKKIWYSPSVQEALAKAGGMWLYDGNKLAWSSKEISRNELRATADLDAHKPSNKRVGNSGLYYLRVTQTAVINLSYLLNYLEGRVGWDNHVLECMNFFDHCMRQTPSEKMISIRRNVYPKDTQSFPLGSIVEAYKGFYSAIRLAEGNRLMINVDTANTAFWQTRTVSHVAHRMYNAHKSEWSSGDMSKLAADLRPVKRTDDKKITFYAESEAFMVLRRLRKLKFVVTHRGKMNEQKIYTIKQIMFDKKYGADGAIASKVTFNKKLPDGTQKEISVYDHYKEQYNVRLVNERLPLIETTRGGFFPMELCNVADYQRYPFKLDPDQTAQMIKFAVTRPPQRRKDIMEGVKRLNFSNDPYLKAFGIKVSGDMHKTKARLLQYPDIAFGGNAKLCPRYEGRWDLRGKRFLEPNQKAITSWGFVVCGNSCTKEDAEAFASKFTQTYRNHGGNIQAPLHVIQVPYSVGNYGEICLAAWNQIGNKFKQFPQLLFFVVSNKNQLVYERIKKSMDCRFVCPSQVLQGGQVKKANAQYMSNVAMKVNAKLGGVTCKVASQVQPFKVPTMMIGVDVSHAAPGSSMASMAAMTVSMDRNATRYAASCEVNGWRVELLQSTTCHTLFPRLLRHWIKIHKTFPQHVYYFRDGVAEGSFQGVIEDEMGEIRRAFRDCNAGNPKITVIIATKRHHIRFFPQQGDKNGNPLPGTLVERDATHPRHFDFYLCSHVAIQGTARPVHYQVIYDDANVKPDELQKLLYEQCYQYARSTTPVSLHPAIYYAHVASNRARSHEDINASQREYAGGKEGHPTAKHSSQVYSGQENLSEPKPLIPMSNKTVQADRIEFMNTTMWYI
ncbi:Piwi domain-containing protein [Xylaria arbuscula]|nr:Piwi domain-containing protein [Xylaria arbuscula]